MVKLGPFSIKKQTFAIVVEATQLTQDSLYDGIIGLGLEADEQQPWIQSVMENLESQELVRQHE